MTNQIEQLSIVDITPYENNPRKNNKAVKRVAHSIKEYGFNQPLVIDHNNVIVVGHTRYRAAKELGMSSVPVIRMPNTVSAEKVRAYRIADNKLNEYAQWDEELLISELIDLLPSSSIQDLSDDTGFSEQELNNWLSTPDNSVLDDLKVEQTTVAKVGDVYTLGDHRLVCGDSTDAGVLKTLLGDERIDCIWEDPPYGVAYKSPNAIVRDNEGQWVDGKSYSEEWVENNSIENDDLSIEQLQDLLNRHLVAVQPWLRNGAAVYWCHDQRYNHEFKQLLQSNGVHVSDTLIWYKNQASTFVGDYCKKYEPILYGWKKGAPHNWYAGRNQYNIHTDEQLENYTKEQLIKIIKNQTSTVQEVKKLNKGKMAYHPTVKPPKLIAMHLLNSTQRGNSVYDGFSGSGSTLIACEKTNRKGRCIEFEPKYIDLTITRWQELTGGQAKRQDGVLWDDI